MSVRITDLPPAITLTGSELSVVVQSGVTKSAPVSMLIDSSMGGLLALKADIASPTFTGTVGGITKAMVGLANVDDTADADKPVSSAQQTALNLKQSLSAKDASDGYAGLTLFKVNFKNASDTFTSFLTNTNTAARTYTFQDRDGTVADDTDLALKAPLASPTFTGTVGGITKAMVGLSSVDDTADADKPVSTAQQTALDLKANLAGPTFTGTTTTAALSSTGLITSTGGITQTLSASEQFLMSGTTAAASAVQIGATNTAANPAIVSVFGTLNPPATTNAIGVNIASALTPQSTLTSFFSALLSSTWNNANAPTNWVGVSNSPTLGASSSGTITNMRPFVAGTPTNSGAAVVTNYEAFLAQDCTLTTTLTAGFRGGMTSGAGKWNAYMSGNANNAFVGNVRIGSAVAPTVALDVTGSALISTTLGVTGAITASSTLAVNGNVTLGNANTDAHTVNGTLQLQSYTVATLPAAGTLGRIACVSDALTPTFLTTVVGGGAIRTPVFDNGTNWVSF